ncbi:MAG: JAB domain-containing protein [Opitutaceae bacterium]|jgi:DNA repair protein RadC
MRVYEAKIVYNLVSLGEDVQLNNPASVAKYVASIFEENPVVESFVTVMLDRRNRPIARHLVTVGTLTCALAHPREVFRAAILANAAALVISHFHPSGDPSPSAADIQLPRQLKAASLTLDIPLLDHVIVGDAKMDPLHKGIYSFREAGLL